MTDREQLHRDGYVLLRGVIPAPWLDELRATFDAGYVPSGEWPVPRGWDWRHAQLDEDARVQAVCRLPAVLAAVGVLIGERFFLAQVEGREPVAGGGHQRLHRDAHGQRTGDRVTAMAFFDDYGPHNGATRIVAGTHRQTADEAPYDLDDESGAVQICGAAGDILVFDVDVVHGASRNPSGARRRSLLINYAAAPLYPALLSTVALRNVRMDTAEQFEPADYPVAGA